MTNERGWRSLYVFIHDNGMKFRIHEPRKWNKRKTEEIGERNVIVSNLLSRAILSHSCRAARKRKKPSEETARRRAEGQEDASEGVGRGEGGAGGEIARHR